MQNPNKSRRTNADPDLTYSKLAAFGALGLPLAMLGIPVYLLLPNYYADQFGLSLASIGLALLLARSFDVVTDPIIGWLSDRYQPKIPRVQQIFFASLALIASLYFLFMPNNPINHQFAISINGVYLFLWSFVVYLAWTWVQIPYQTLLSEITHRSHSKTQLASSRELFGILGVLLATALPVILAVEPQSAKFFDILWVLIIGLIVVAYLSLKTLSPTIEDYNQSTRQQSLLNSHLSRQTHRAQLNNVFANKSAQASLSSRQITPFWRQLRALKQAQPQLFAIMPSFFLNNLANAFPATLFILFVSDYLNLAEDTGVFLIAYFLAGVIALPFWLFAAKRFGKLVTWRASILLATIGFCGVFWLNAGDFSAYLAICLITGLSLGVDLALPSSIQADLVQQQKADAHKTYRLKTYTRKTAPLEPIAATQPHFENEIENKGLIFGLWGMLTKLALALAIGLSFPVLDWLQNYAPANRHDGLLLFYAALPIILKLLAWHYLNRLKRNQIGLL